MKKILFLCTGNYYRSRFSEEYFNHFATEYDLAWSADSMGIQRDFSGNGNVGPMSKWTLDELKYLGIPPVGQCRMPRRVEEEDLLEFDRVIAVSRDEHQPMLTAIWPDELLVSIEYFDVEDLHIYGAETALPKLKKHLDVLINDLHSLKGT